MLRSWLDVTTIALSPEGVAVRRGSDIRLLPMEGLSASSLSDLLEKLPQLAQKRKVRRVRFILSSRFVRHAVLPWSPDVVYAHDWQSLGEHHMHKLFGAVADQWEVRVSLQGEGKPVVVCAIERALLSMIEKLSASMGWFIQGIEPAIMAVFNHFCRESLAPSFCLMMAEPQRLLLAEVSAGAWKRFELASPPSGQEREECANMMARAMRASGHEPIPEFIAFGPFALLPEQGNGGSHLRRVSASVRQGDRDILTMLASF